MKDGGEGDEGDFKLFEGFPDRQTDGQTTEPTDICDCRVTFTTENLTETNNSRLYFLLIISEPREIRIILSWKSMHCPPDSQI